MFTPFDFLTVACFVGLAIAFFQLTQRQPRTLLHLCLCVAGFAIANQVGNNGSIVLALILVGASVSYGILVIRDDRNH